MQELQLELVQEANQYGVLPSGNIFLAEADDGRRVKGGKARGGMRASGLGPQLARLEDSTLVMELLSCLDGDDLARRALYVFSHHSDLWKTLLVQALLTAHPSPSSPPPPRLVFRRSWKESFIRHHKRQQQQQEEEEEPLHVPLRMRPGLPSDFLYQPLLAAGVRRFPRAWLAVDNVMRLHQPSLQEFRRRAEVPNVPVVITGVVDEWPAYHACCSATHGSLEALARAAGHEGGGVGLLHGGGLSFSLPDYARYAREQRDDLPLYIFDKAFHQAWPQLAAGYSAPSFLGEDLFSLLEERRPDWRWLIMGPRGSGSSFHKDPNSTSAWNAVLRGAKKWVLFPPSATPPGVHPSHDGLELATPVTLVEWFTGFYKEARGRGDAVECVVREGELMWVPRGWWHLVLNLDESVAITQNYVNSVNLPHVLRLLDEQRHLVSGLPDDDRPLLYDRFVACLQQHRPQVLQEAQEARKRGRAGGQQEEARPSVAHVFAPPPPPGGGKGEQQADGLGGEGGAGGGGFSFNFQLS